LKRASFGKVCLEGGTYIGCVDGFQIFLLLPRGLAARTESARLLFRESLSFGFAPYDFSKTHLLFAHTTRGEEESGKHPFTSRVLPPAYLSIVNLKGGTGRLVQGDRCHSVQDERFKSQNFACEAVNVSRKE